MKLRSYFLAAAGATVVIGGIYLWLEVRGTSAEAPSPDAVAEAQARHVKAGTLRPEGERGGERTGDRAEHDRAAIDRPAARIPRPRPGLPMNDPAVFDGPLSDRLRAPPGALDTPIDPADPEAASAMTEANKSYDRGDYVGARDLALKLLGRDPANVRMLRVAVSASCILGDADVANQHWARLPAPDQQQMAIRCSRYQVTFPTAGASPQK